MLRASLVVDLVDIYITLTPTDLNVTSPECMSQVVGN